MYLTQALSTEGVHVVGVADLAPQRARAALERTGWPAERYAAADFDEALRSGGTHVTDSADALIDAPDWTWSWRSPAIRWQARITLSGRSMPVGTS
ncbi:hypothetical protein [Saccharopolyspora sp. ASAGF58]|uniref:hypothetical protein n=1 Tax=Saccharopolyspora sp. ASAGF58 TaxID=2719023 RepID=UPI001B314FD7|nr:hypothetical protein [Saccharopolyspora sp. ASAGF58]